jgi:AraC-like DNA-binding protein
VKDKRINMRSDKTAAFNCALGRPLDCGPLTGIDAPQRDYDALVSTVALVDFPESVARLVRISLRQGQSQIRSIASAAGISVRTLQRRLAECGLEYSALVEGARFEIAADLLKNQRCKLIDIAYDVGYADAASFTRAFRRWTGVTPSEYRHLHSFTLMPCAGADPRCD